MLQTDSYRLETRLAQSGGPPDPATGALIPPLHMATTYERAADGSYPHGYIYSRTDNPTRRLFETTLAGLEGGSVCMAFASGMAASQSVLQALVPGDHLLLPTDVYHGVRYLLDTVFTARGIGYTEVDMGDLDALEAAFHPATRLVWIETPSNPMLHITDIAGVVERAHARNVPVLVDGTWTTPLLQQPLALGADFVLHSVTKYLGGHSDVLGGALVAAREDGLAAQIRTIQTAGGGVMDPFSAWLTLRGMRSMAARLRMQCAHASAVAAFLADHPRVARVHYPGLPDHPGHAVARRQMRDFGAMLSFEVEGGRDAAMTVAARTRVFARATSLGGTESLIEHRASVEPPATRTPQGLLRLSIGLEHPDDLISDLSQALAG